MHVGRKTVPAKEASMLPRVSKELFPVYVGYLSICNKKHYLQQEPGAFGHEGERYHRRDTGQRADNDEDTPAVKLVGWAHAEAPPWKRRQEEWGGLSLGAGQEIHPGISTTDFSVEFYCPQRNKRVRYGDQRSLKRTIGSVEMKMLETKGLQV